MQDKGVTMDINMILMLIAIMIIANGIEGAKEEIIDEIESRNYDYSSNDELSIYDYEFDEEDKEDSIEEKISKTYKLGYYTGKEFKNLF
jgi:hypothetical protein